MVFVCVVGVQPNCLNAVVQVLAFLTHSPSYCLVSALSSLSLELFPGFNSCTLLKGRGENREK